MDDSDAASPGSGSPLGAALAMLAPSEEIREFTDSARTHFAREFPTSVLRGILEGGAAPMEAWPSIVEQGYLLVGAPEAAGGFGTLADLVPVLEAAGRSLIPLPLLATVAATQTLLRAGLDAASPDTPPGALALVAADGRTLTAFDGLHASWFALVRATPSGVEVQRVTGRIVDRAGSPAPIDPSRADVEVEVGEVLDSVALDGRGPDDVLAAARVCVAADLVGVAAVALDGAIEHAKLREQFGRPIGSFQGVKHLLADVYVAVERARSLTYGAAAELVSQPSSTTAIVLSLLAKAAASDAAVAAAGVQVQLLGAMGLTYETDTHLIVRRARQTAAWLGAASDLHARAGALHLEEAHRA